MDRDKAKITLAETKVDEVVLISWADPVIVLEHGKDDVLLYDISQTFAPESLRKFTRKKKEICYRVTYAEYMVEESQRWLGTLTVPEKQKILDKYEGVEFPHNR